MNGLDTDRASVRKSRDIRLRITGRSATGPLTMLRFDYCEQLLPSGDETATEGG
jgi:hypothetical protein